MNYFFWIIIKSGFFLTYCNVYEAYNQNKKFFLLIQELDNLQLVKKVPNIHLESHR